MTLTLNGKTKDIKDWSVETGLTVSTIFSRKARGWSDEKTLTDPTVTSSNKITKNDCELFLNDVKYGEKLDRQTSSLLSLVPETVMKRGQYLRRYHPEKFQQYFQDSYKPKHKK